MLEAFCYALETLGRATLIGETAGGGARGGTGVAPDIKVPAADALAEALRLARGLT